MAVVVHLFYTKHLLDWKRSTSRASSTVPENELYRHNELRKEKSPERELNTSKTRRIFMWRGKSSGLSSISISSYLLSVSNIIYPGVALRRLPLQWEPSIFDRIQAWTLVFFKSSVTPFWTLVLISITPWLQTFLIYGNSCWGEGFPRVVYSLCLPSLAWETTHYLRVSGWIRIRLVLRRLMRMRHLPLLVELPLCCVKNTNASDLLLHRRNTHIRQGMLRNPEKIIKNSRTNPYGIAALLVESYPGQIGVSAEDNWNKLWFAPKKQKILWWPVSNHE